MPHSSYVLIRCSDHSSTWGTQSSRFLPKRPLSTRRLTLPHSDSGRDPEPKRVPLPRICSDVTVFIISPSTLNDSVARHTSSIYVVRISSSPLHKIQTPRVDPASSTSQPKLAATADKTTQTTAISIFTPPRCLLNANISSPPSSTPSASNSPPLCSSLNIPHKQRPHLRPPLPITTTPHPPRGRYPLPWLRITALRHMASRFTRHGRQCRFRMRRGQIVVGEVIQAVRASEMPSGQISGILVVGQRLGRKSSLSLAW